MSLLARFRLNRPEEIAPSARDTVSQFASERGSEQRDNGPHTVNGERGVASIHGTRSLQSRVSNVLAAGLMGALALGFLTWYYTHAFAGRSREQATEASRTKLQVQGEMLLPPLGRVDQPVVEKVLGPPPEMPPASTFALERFSGNAVPMYSAPSIGSPQIRAQP